jgi:predicted MFS family arabinose efflux permease
VVGLIAAEVFPISLLTPIARDLQVSEVVVGQTVTVTAASAMLASLFTATLARTIDRRIVFAAFAVFLTVSNLMSAFASDITTLFISRLLLGLALGGFWSLAAAVSAQLAPDGQVSRALAIVYGSISIALVVAPPSAAFIANYMGWRSVFLIGALWGALALSFQLYSLPCIVPAGTAKLSALFDLLRNKIFVTGLMCVFLFYGAHFAFLTFLRPFLETNLALGVGAVAAIFLLFGGGNFWGTHISGRYAGHYLGVILLVVPLAMAIMALLLACFDNITMFGALLVVCWGFAFGMGPVAWATWMTRVAKERTESAGSLQIACVQVAVASGAGIGGVMFSAGGSFLVFSMCSVALLVTSLLVKTLLSSGDGLKTV